MPDSPFLSFSVPFILASGSPRRQRLLQHLGLAFDVVVSDVEETAHPGEPPASLVQRLAAEKAAAVAACRPDALTLGADTVVVFGDEVLGKPADAAEAEAMLRRLSGQTHVVHTGIALTHPASERLRTASETTRVTFAALSDDEIRSYVRTGSPLDKAGAYGIQDDHGAFFIQRIDGDYYNVVGLPLHCLYQTLRHAFGDILRR